MLCCVGCFMRHTKQPMGYTAASSCVLCSDRTSLSLVQNQKLLNTMLRPLFTLRMCGSRNPTMEEVSKKDPASKTAVAELLKVYNATPPHTRGKWSSRANTFCMRSCSARALDVKRNSGGNICGNMHRRKCRDSTRMTQFRR